MTHDPLCPVDEPCVCDRLRLARLQGPVIHGYVHPPLCTCERCLVARPLERS